ncbi:UDP-glucuronosyltransferase 2B17-like [Oryzias melastigma]|uniref:UDP-glucuronosyltransferase n=1 Tax=Oryzias melastigma TaxID=30732 RepID=A0A3B3DQC0_ORYME|nr:UDP-glucuronosyltransferase 2B17-like [Oryzias melastigma]XP_036068770.1 UDP-glucuronosyltransferase 2B17-like [Oryzias melastigma]
MASFPALVFFLLATTSLHSRCEAGKVLVYPVDGSHWTNMIKILEALHSKGHQITVLRSSTSWYISETSPYYTSITITQKQPQNIESQTSMATFMRQTLESRQYQGTLKGFFEFYRLFFNLIGDTQKSVANVAASIIENKTLVKELNQSEYDVFLTDPVFPAGVLLAHHLKLPLVLNVRWIVGGDPHYPIAPSPLSYIPVVFSHHTDKMSFIQRVKNVIYKGMLVYLHRYVSNPPYQAVCDRYFERGVSVMSLMQGADLWLIRTDFTFDFPRPTMPNVVYIGGFQCKPASPLPTDLEDFMQSSGEHGVIIMTLGTLLGDLGPNVSEIFAAAFANFPQKVLWRHTGPRPATLGNNTMLVKWLPQNDILGHPKTRLFVTHGGTNGVFEALFHSVPILGIPLIFDQYDNLVRMEAHGVAEIIDITAMDVKSLTNSLQNILDPTKPYKENMIKLSQIYRDQPIKPMDKAVFWIEFVMRHKGAAHLRTESYKLPWYAYHCLDAMAVIAVVGLFMLAFTLASCRCLFRCLTRMKKSKTE